MTDRTSVEPIPESHAPSAWQPSLRLLRRLRRIFGDEKVIDIPEVSPGAVGFFVEVNSDTVTLIAEARREDDEHA